MNTGKKWLIEDREMLLFIIAYTLIALRFIPASLWWDSAVYIAMGKYIWSAGAVGLWEPARPILLPFLLGAVWKLGMLSFFVKLIPLVMSSLALFMVYRILRMRSSKAGALFFTLLFSVQLPFFLYAGKILSDIPAMAFFLVSIYFLLRKSPALSGFFYSLAVLTKFTYVILGPVILAALLLDEKRKGLLLRFAYGFLPLSLVFLFANSILYSNPLLPFLEANSLINTVWLNEASVSTAWFYLFHLAISVPLVIVFFLIFPFTEIQSGYRRNRKELIVLLGCVVIPLIYHSLFLDYRDERYMVIFLPYLFISAGYAFSILSKKSRRLWKILHVFLAIQIAYSLFVVSSAGVDNNKGENLYDEVYTFFDAPLSGEIWMSNPYIAAEKDIRVDELVYYPVWGAQRADALRAKDRSTVAAILINTCDIPCLRRDKECSRKTQDFLAELEETHRVISRKESGACTMMLYGKHETQSALLPQASSP